MPIVKTVPVALGADSYDIQIGSGLLKDLKALELPLGKEVMVVTNDTVAPLYLDLVLGQLAQLCTKVESICLPDGEQFKNLTTLNCIFDRLLELNFSRSCTLIALGGGVIGDMCGYAAASYQRGVDFIQMPTTLLSQVDSSVGGKTGVNHKLGKNMIGAFKQPKRVVIDTDTLNTLPPREYSAGLAEVIKYGLVRDAQLMQWLQSNLAAIMAKESTTLAEVVAWNCKIKADIVSKDEKEHGVRALLNLGHTFGHAIENHFGYGTLLHGEAVAIGIMMALRMSQIAGKINDDEYDQVGQWLQSAGLPTSLPGAMSAEDFILRMSKDKKVDSGTMKLILLNAIGDGLVSSTFSTDHLQQVLAEFCYA